MKRARDRRMAGTASAALVVCLAIIAACAAPGPAVPGRTAASAPPAMPTAADPWQALLAKVPYPYLLPLPRAATSVLDGTYAKVEPAEADSVHCLRCPDYAREGGVWKLNLAGGVFRIYHEDSGWSSLGSFVVTHDRISKVDFPDKLLLFNDPYCPDVVGVYRWTVAEGSLQLQMIDDTCSYQLRGANLANRPWLSCHPPNAEAGTTDHWPKPPGCE
jgi:hypothetical protein